MIKDHVFERWLMTKKKAKFNTTEGFDIHDVIRDVERKKERKKERKTPEAMEK